MDRSSAAPTTIVGSPAKTNQDVAAKVGMGIAKTAKAIATLTRSATARLCVGSTAATMVLQGPTTTGQIEALRTMLTLLIVAGIVVQESMVNFLLFKISGTFLATEKTHKFDY